MSNTEESIAYEDRDTGSEAFPVYDYYDLNLNLLNAKHSNYGTLGLRNRATIGLNPTTGLGGTNLGLNSLGLNNAQLLQNRLFNDYGDYGQSVYGHGYHGLGHYCQEDQVHIGLLVTTIAGIGIMWYTLYTKIQANGGRSYFAPFLDSILSGKFNIQRVKSQPYLEKSYGS